MLFSVNKLPFLYILFSMAGSTAHNTGDGWRLATREVYGAPPPVQTEAHGAARDERRTGWRDLGQTGRRSCWWRSGKRWRPGRRPRLTLGVEQRGVVGDRANGGGFFAAGDGGRLSRAWGEKRLIQNLQVE